MIYILQVLCVFVLPTTDCVWFVRVRNDDETFAARGNKVNIHFQTWLFVASRRLSSLRVSFFRGAGQLTKYTLYKPQLSVMASPPTLPQ